MITVSGANHLAKPAAGRDFDAAFMRCLFAIPQTLRTVSCSVLPACLALTLAATPLAVAGGLPEKIQNVINGTNYQQATWGLLFVDLQTGETVYELNADKLVAPASVTKLYTVAAALDTFGAGHHFETSIYRRGEVDSAGVLRGKAARALGLLRALGLPRPLDSLRRGPGAPPAGRSPG